MEKRALITGHRGLIGRRLTATLRQRGWEVVEWPHDLLAIGQCREPTAVVFHLAAVARYDQFREAPQRGYEVNVIGTAAVLGFCERVGARCVVASTSGVYQGSDNATPLSEDAPVAPSSPYAWSKWLAERLSKQWADDAGVGTTVLRLFNVYGPGQHPAFLVPYVLGCLRKGRPIALRMPEAMRDFVHVDDVANAFCEAGTRAGKDFRIYNVGSGHPMRVREFVTTAAEVCGVPAQIASGATHAGELTAAVADIARARQELGWSPQVTLTEGLRTCDP